MEGHWTQRIRNAIVIASNWHDGQRRKEANIPYNAHLWGVSLKLAQAEADDDEIIAGIFHDILEDTPMKPELLGWIFGSTVLGMVKELTEPKKDLPWKARKKVMIERIKNASLSVKLICCADKLDNLQSIYEALRAEGFRQGHDNSQAAVWNEFRANYTNQKWYNQEILKSLFANVPLKKLPPMFGTYMRLVEAIFGEQVIKNKAARQRVLRKL